MPRTPLTCTGGNPGGLPHLRGAWRGTRRRDPGHLPHAVRHRIRLARIRDHLRQSAQVSRSEIAAGGRADAREPARALVRARENFLAELERLPGAVRALG